MGRHKLDLTGQKFGRLTVLEDAGRTKQSKVLWRCLCDCGNTVDVRSSDLIGIKTQSCGCYNKERITERRCKDLIGQKFGNLSVLEEVGRKDGRVLWKCLCKCGNIYNVSTNRLQSGHTKSCGCYQKGEMLGENNRFWKGGVTPLHRAIRPCAKYREWRNQVFKRDSYTCQHCGDKRGGKLNAHHIKFFSTLMEENHITTLEEAIQCEALWDVSNGITLCVKCHKKEHARLRTLDNGN